MSKNQRPPVRNPTPQSASRKPGPKTHGDDDSGLVKRTFWITHRQNAQLTALPPYTKSDVLRLALQQFFGDSHAHIKTPKKKA